MRFYFHLHDELATHDREGRDLPDLDAALAYARHEARVMAAASVARGTLNLAHRIDITDSAGVLVGQIYFGEAIDLEK